LGKEYNEAYEVVFGCYGNTKTELRQGAHGEILSTVETPGVVSCDEFRYFWLDWNHTASAITIGVGRFGSHTVIKHPLSRTSHITVFTFNSWEDEGIYQVTEDHGKWDIATQNI
jgi:hypothetical protein